MPNLTSVGITAGLPTSGTGTVSTIDQLLAVGTKVTDGTNISAVKAASTQALATDPSLVVQVNPNSPGVLTTGVPGTAATQVVSVQGVASMTPLKVDSSGITGPVNIAQVNGNTAAAGLGATTSGTIRTTLASDSFGIIGVGTQAAPSANYISTVAAGDIASAATDSGNPVKIGGIGHTANPTAVTDGQRVNATFDKLGKQVVAGSIRDLKGNQVTLVSTGTETTVITAVAGVFLDVYGCIIANTSTTTGLLLLFKDSTAGTTQFEFYVPAGDTRGFMLPESAALKQTTVNNNWTVTMGAAVNVIITMLYVKNT